MATRIAIVDDSAVALQWAKEELEGQGFEVVTYNAPLGIQAFVRATKPSLVLLDVGMPALSGDTVCKLIKSKPATQEVVVALYSSMPEQELRERAHACGADGYIVKSRATVELVRQIQALLRRAGV